MPHTIVESHGSNGGCDRARETRVGGTGLSAVVPSRGRDVECDERVDIQCGSFEDSKFMIHSCVAIILYIVYTVPTYS